MSGRTPIVFIGVVAAVGLVVVSRPRPASAQSANDRASAVALFDAGKALLAENQIQLACEKFRESQRVDPQLGTLLHLADCQERAGQTASAWAHWRDGIELAQKRGDAREQVARERAAALEPKLVRLTIRVTTPELEGLEVRRDGVVVGRAMWGSAVPLDPGKHALEAVAPGKIKWTQTFDLGAEAEAHTALVPELKNAPKEPLRTPTASVKDMGQAPPDRIDTGVGNSQRLAAWVAGGAGVAALGLGSYFAVERLGVLSDRDKVCPEATNCTQAESTKNAALTRDARNAQTLMFIGFGAGGALLTTGAVLYLTAPRARAPSAYAVAPWFDRDGGGASVGGVW